MGGIGMAASDVLAERAQSAVNFSCQKLEASSLRPAPHFGRQVQVRG